MSALRNAALLAALCLCLDCCSIVGTPRNPDVTGFGPVKWGMTLDQVKTVIGPNSKIMTDPATGASIASVTFTIEGVQLSGFASTDLQTHRVTGLHLFSQNGGPGKQPSFDSLERAIVKRYGAPSSDLALTHGRTCFWGFPSGSILLVSYTAPSSVSLSFSQNPAGISAQIPLQN